MLKCVQPWRTVRALLIPEGEVSVRDVHITTTPNPARPLRNGRLSCAHSSKHTRYGTQCLRPLFLRPAIAAMERRGERALRQSVSTSSDWLVSFVWTSSPSPSPSPLLSSASAVRRSAPSSASESCKRGRSVAIPQDTSSGCSAWARWAERARDGQQGVSVERGGNKHGGHALDTPGERRGALRTPGRAEEGEMPPCFRAGWISVRCSLLHPSSSHSCSVLREALRSYARLLVLDEMKWVGENRRALDVEADEALAKREKHKQDDVNDGYTAVSWHSTASGIEGAPPHLRGEWMVCL